MAAVLFAAIAPIAASALPAQVDVRPHWHVGDHADYVLEKKSRVTVSGAVSVDAVNTTPVHVEVIAANADGYVLSWTGGPTHFDGTTQAMLSPAMKKLATILAGCPIQMKLDPMGRLMSIANWKTVRDVGDAFAEDFRTTLLQNGAGAVKSQEAVERIRAMFSTEASVRQAATRDAQLWLLPLGHAYTLEGPTRFDAVMPDPVSAQATRVVEQALLRMDGAIAHVSWTPNASDMEVRGAAVMDLVSGWPVSVAQTVSASDSGTQRVETTAFGRK